MLKKLDKNVFRILSIVMCIMGVLACKHAYPNILFHPENQNDTFDFTLLTAIRIMYIAGFVCLLAVYNSKRGFVAYCTITLVTYAMVLILQLPYVKPILEGLIGIPSMTILMILGVKPIAVKAKTVKILGVFIIVLMIVIMVVSIRENYTIILSKLNLSYSYGEILIKLTGFITEDLPQFFVSYIYPLATLEYVYNEKSKEAQQ